MTRPPRILVLRGGALGDFVVTLPVFQALRTRWPEAHVELIGYPRVAEIARWGGWVDAIRSLDQAGMARFFALKPSFSEEQATYIRSFDIVLNFLHDPDGSLNDNLKAAGARILIHGSPMVTQSHAIDHFLKPLESLALYAVDPVPLVRRGAGKLERCTDAVLIHPGSGGRSKNWMLDRYLELADRLERRGCSVGFLAGEAEEPFRKALECSGVDVRWNLPIIDLCVALETAGLYIGNDSGVTHLAAACQCPTLALFGPSPADRWAPRGIVCIVQAPDGDLSKLTVDAVWEQLGRMREV